MLESFLKSPMEESFAESALKAGGSAPIFEDDEYYNLLDRFNCRTKVTALNVYGVIVELA